MSPRWSSVVLVVLASCGSKPEVEPVDAVVVQPSGSDTAADPVPEDDPDDPADSGEAGETTDSGTTDSGTTDSGTTDSGTPDTGEPDDPWFGGVLDPTWPVPDFEVSDQDGVLHGAEALVGAPTVVWFFRDTASSCTNDACGYRDLQPEFDALGVRIVGVGPTSVADNAAWAASLDYDYQIWSDVDGTLATAYNVGSDFDEGNLRHAFLLDDSGSAFLRYEGAVSLGADPLQVLADCRALYGTD